MNTSTHANACTGIIKFNRLIKRITELLKELDRSVL